MRLYSVTTTPTSGLHSCSLGSDQTRSDTRPAGRTASRSEHGHGRADESAAGAAGREGLKPGALGLVSTTVIATASVAPAYSIAATLVFVVGAVGLQAPAVTVLAFVPMLLTSIGYSELNKADPDCGTTFTWATRAFGPRSGWAGGWAIIVADVLVMASLAQVAGQYVFFLFNADGIGANPGQRLGAARRRAVDRGDDLRRLPGH